MDGTTFCDHQQPTSRGHQRRPTIFIGVGSHAKSRRQQCCEITLALSEGTEGIWGRAVGMAVEV